MLLAVHAKDPEDECCPWCKREKKYMEYPAIIRQYNSKMGEIDPCDHMWSYYRIKT